MPAMAHWLVASHEDVADAEAAVVRRSLVGGALGLGADGDGGVAVVADLDVVPGQLRGDHAAGVVAIEPLLAIENEAERPDEAEVVGDHRCEGGGVAGDLGVGPALAELDGRRRWSWS